MENKYYITQSDLNAHDQVINALQAMKDSINLLSDSITKLREHNSFFDAKMELTRLQIELPCLHMKVCQQFEITIEKAGKLNDEFIKQENDKLQ